MKKLLLLTFALATVTQVWAIRYVSTGSSLVMGAAAQSLPLDFNEDSINDLVFYGVQQLQSIYLLSTFSPPANVDMVVVDMGTYELTEGLPSGTSVGPNSNWSSTNTGLILSRDTDPNIYNTGDRFIGFRFSLGSSYWYGWAWVNFSGTNPRVFTLRGYALEDVLDQPIAVGDTGGGSFISLNERTLPNFRIYPNPAVHQVVIESNDPIKKIEIINLSGKSLLYSEYQESNLQEVSLSVSDLPSGLYTIGLYKNKGIRQTVKFVKEN